MVRELNNSRDREDTYESDKPPKPKRKLRFPHFRKAKLAKGLFGPKYQFFKKEMDKRFDLTYAAKLQLHREEMQRRREEKLERMQMQALQEQQKSQQMQMIYLNGNPAQQRQIIFLEHYPPH